MCKAAWAGRVKKNADGDKKCCAVQLKNRTLNNQPTGAPAKLLR